MCRTELSVQAIVDHQQAGKKGTHGVQSHRDVSSEFEGPC